MGIRGNLRIFYCHTLDGCSSIKTSQIQSYKRRLLHTKNTYPRVDGKGYSVGDSIIICQEAKIIEP